MLPLSVNTEQGVVWTPLFVIIKKKERMEGKKDYWPILGYIVLLSRPNGLTDLTQ